MPELLRKQVSARSTRAGLMACALRALPVLAVLAAVPALAATETLPASVRACAAETDSLKRLMCYDREVARFPAAVAKVETPAPAASATSSSQAASVPRPAPSVATPPAATLQPAPTRQTAPPVTALAATSSSNSAPPPAESTTAADPRHFTARVVSIEHIPNEMILHLDNGQVWQEVQAVSGDLSLREGDTVQIDKHLGSYWLSGPHVSSMKVKQKS